MQGDPATEPGDRSCETPAERGFFWGWAVTVTQYIGLKFLVGALAVAFIALGFGFGLIGEWWERRRAKAYEAEVREWEARL